MYSYIYIYICENCKSERGPPRVCVLCILCSQCGARLQREIRRAALEIPRVMFAPPRVSPSSCVTRLARRSVAGPTRLRRSGHEGDAWPLPRPLRRGLRPALVYTPRLLDGWAHGWPRMGGRDVGGGGVGGGGGAGGGGACGNVGKRGARGRSRAGLGGERGREGAQGREVGKRGSNGGGDELWMWPR